MDGPPRRKKPVDLWGDERIRPGESRDIHLTVSESSSGMQARVPIHVSRAEPPGPVVSITAALHGDEINGTGVVRELVTDATLRLKRGSLILIPVLNLLAFDRHSRYLPDRRDLNRSFPGDPLGSLAARMANTIFEEIIHRSDFVIDLHTAAVRRTNYPSVRADLDDPAVARLARVFGTEVILHGKGPPGSLRREACLAGCPTIVMEGGEVWKVERFVLETGARGVKNVLRELGMIDGQPDRPDYQVRVENSKWIRADHGGFLQFHVQPGEIVEKGQLLATNTNLLGRERNVLESPFDAVVIGMTTLPAVSPGEPVCHLGRLPKGTQARELRRLRRLESGLEERVVDDLATNVYVVDPRKP